MYIILQLRAKTKIEISFGCVNINIFIKKKHIFSIVKLVAKIKQAYQKFSLADDLFFVKIFLKA